MKHQHRFVIAAALALIIGTVLVLCLWPRKKPTWQGKTYSQWFAEFREAKVRHRQSVQSFGMPAGSSKFVPTTGYYDDIDGLLRDPVADSLRAMGTNILPFLTDEIRHEDNYVIRTYRDLYWKFPTGIKRLAPGPSSGRDEIRVDAALALTALRADAAPAVPTVYRAFATARPYARGGFQESLRRLPFDDAALDAALDTLVRRRDLSSAVSLVNQFGVRNLNSVRILTNAVFSTNAPASDAAFAQLRYCRRYHAFVLPTLREAVKTGDQAARWHAASTLELYEAEAAEALPELVAALRSDDGELRYRAARALEAIGTNALPAAQALASATNDSSVMVQRAAARAVSNLKKDANP
jgi:hypothetical protein